MAYFQVFILIENEGEGGDPCRDGSGDAYLFGFAFFLLFFFFFFNEVFCVTLGRGGGGRGTMVNKNMLTSALE